MKIQAYQEVAGLTLLELMAWLEERNWGYKLGSRASQGSSDREYWAAVFGDDELGGGQKVYRVGSPLEALTEAYVNCLAHRLGRFRRLGRTGDVFTPGVLALDERKRETGTTMPPGDTIEEQAVNLLSLPLASCVRQRTAFGIEKYGQRLDDNHQEGRARAIHFIHEMLDGLQYALWDGDALSARQCANLAVRKQVEYQLSPAEIMAGGKQ